MSIALSSLASLFFACQDEPPKPPVRDLEAEYEVKKDRRVERDAFPVFNHPTMVDAATAEKDGAVVARDLVLGLFHNGEAKAYPVPILGIHELGNDKIGGVPVAVSW